MLEQFIHVQQVELFTGGILHPYRTFSSIDGLLHQPAISPGQEGMIIRHPALPEPLLDPVYPLLVLCP